MDRTTYATHTQTMYLQADEPPPFPPRAKHWVVSSTTGILPRIDPKDHAAFLETLPGRIVTVSMLHHLYCYHIMTVLLIIWVYALCCRSLRLRHGVTRLYALGSSFLMLLVLCFAYAGWLRSCVLAVATTAALCGDLLDAMGLLAVLALAHEGWTTTAITLTVAYAVWAKDSRNTCHLPEFATFLAGLRPLPPAPEVSEEDEDDGYLVCWSSEEALLQLPCREGHSVCRDCLLRMYDADKYRCPFCRKELFIYKSKSFRHCLRYIITTANVLRFTLHSMLLTLLLYKGRFWITAVNTLLTAASVALERNMRGMMMGNGDWDLANARLAFLGLILVWTVYMAWCEVAAVQTWDQVTLWNGAVLKGVGTRTGYAVARG